VRHGETEGSGAKRYHGSIDVPLSENGVSQMRGAAAFISEHLKSSGARQQMSYLKDIHRQDTTADEVSGSGILAALYCSDLSRSLKSAEIVGEAFGLRPIVLHDLRERGFGIWEGMTFLDIRERYPQEFESWAVNPLKYSPPGGESTLRVKDRVIGAVEGLISRHDGEHLGIVAHGGVNRIILCHFLGVPLENVFRIEQSYAAVNIIEFWDKYPVIKLMNRVPYE
jgi:broad specificity phosphatase PhoE